MNIVCFTDSYNTAILAYKTTILNRYTFSFAIIKNTESCGKTSHSHQEIPPPPDRLSPLSCSHGRLSIAIPAILVSVSIKTMSKQRQMVRIVQSYQSNYYVFSQPQCITKFFKNILKILNMCYLCNK